MVKSFPDQKQYLKKYLSGTKQKNLKKKSVDALKGVKLIDDDESMKPADLDDDEIFLDGEEAPQIVLGDGVDSSALQDGLKKWKSISAVQIKVQEKTKFLNNFSAISLPSTSNFKEEEKIGNLNQRQSHENGCISKHKKYINEKLSHSLKDKCIYTDDLSPARCNKDLSPITKKPRGGSQDFSPERKNFKKSGRNKDLSPPKRIKRNSSSDLSPQRTITAGKIKSKDLSPSKNTEAIFKSNMSVESKSDLSKRKRSSRWDDVKMADKSQNLSPIMQKARSSSSDPSPPRKKDFEKRNKKEFPTVGQQPSPSNGRSVRRSSSRNLPSQRKIDLEKRSRSKDLKGSAKKRDDSRDLLVKRKRSPSSDLSPERKTHQRNSSPIKRKTTYNSPTRSYKNNSRSRSRTRQNDTRNQNENLTTQQNNSPSLSTHRFSQKNCRKEIPNENRITKMADGKMSGLRNANDLQEDLKDLRAREHEILKETSVQAGQFAEPVIRSHARYKPESLESQIKNKKKEEENVKKQEVYNRWGKGLKQIEDHKARVVDQEYESGKPLARYADDQDLDKMLKQVEREGDPMLQYLRSKKEKDRVNKKQPEIPIYKGSYPENRFGIRPGYRWDGVDRSNGYEKKYFEKQSAKRALEEEAYRYSTEDM